MKRGEIVNSIIEALTPLNVPLYEWRVAPADFDELPVIVIRDREDNIEEEASGSAKHNLKVEIEYTAAKKDLTAKDVRETVQSILTSLKNKDEENPIGDYVSVKNVELDFEHHEVIVGRGMIELEITYYTEKWGI